MFRSKHPLSTLKLMKGCTKDFMPTYAPIFEVFGESKGTKKVFRHLIHPRGCYFPDCVRQRDADLEEIKFLSFLFPQCPRRVYLYITI